MKTPMQELHHWVATELKLDGYEHRVILDKIESMLEKEKAELQLAFEDERDLLSCYEDGSAFEEYYNETFNAEEK